MLKLVCGAYLSSQAERRRRLGLPPEEEPSVPKPAVPVLEEKKVPFLLA